MRTKAKNDEHKKDILIYKTVCTHNSAQFPSISQINFEMCAHKPEEMVTDPNGRFVLVKGFLAQEEIVLLNC